MGQVALISGRERRRQWSGEDRARILRAISAPGAVVAEVARPEDICTSLVHKWRNEARKAVKRVEFAPVVVEAAAPKDVSEPGVVIVEMNEARVRIGASAPSALAAAILKALRT